VKNVSAERVWTPTELQTVGAAAQNALAASDIVAGCCCRRRAEVERVWVLSWSQVGASCNQLLMSCFGLDVLFDIAK